MTSRNHSVFDDLHSDLFGYVPIKSGEAFERIIAVVEKLLSEEADVTHDIKMKGISDALHQIDVYISSANGNIAVEAKDHTLSNDSVGIGAVRNFFGALSDIDVGFGHLFSATGFTDYAKKFASVSQNLSGKSIDLIHLRPFFSADMDGRITTIILTITVLMPTLGDYKPLLTQHGNEIFKQIYSEDTKIQINISELYDNNGDILYKVKELCAVNFCRPECTDVHSCFLTPGGHIRSDNNLIPIHGIEFVMHCRSYEEVIEIHADGDPKLILHREGYDDDIVFTDQTLKQFSFDPDGNVV